MTKVLCLPCTDKIEENLPVEGLCLGILGKMTCALCGKTIGPIEERDESHGKSFLVVNYTVVRSKDLEKYKNCLDKRCPDNYI